MANGHDYFLLSLVYSTPCDNLLCETQGWRLGGRVDNFAHFLHNHAGALGAILSYSRLGSVSFRMTEVAFLVTVN